MILYVLVVAAAATDTSIDLTGLGAILVGLAAVIGSLASFWMAIKNTKKIRDIDHAVNGKPPGAMPMQKQVADLHSDRPIPPRYPPELENAAVRDMLRELVADLHERRRND